MSEDGLHGRMGGDHVEFATKAQNRQLVVGILGLGYVGLPLALSVSRAGHRVIGFDVLPERIEQMRNGISPFEHLSGADIRQMTAAGFEATMDFARAADCDALILCVPTPLNRHREPDLGFVTATMDSIAPYLRAGQLLSLESTTWPGTTTEILKPYIDRAGLTPGRDFYLVYSPEREDPGNPAFNTQTIPKIVGGHTPDCLAAGAALYGTFIDTVVQVSSTETAEMVKLLENIHRSVNIGLANEMKIVAEKMGLDIFEIINAAATKPFGFTPFYPGPGIGGHCIPVDPFYLTWKARAYGIHTRFIELAGEINAAMPQYVCDRILRALSDRGKAMKGARVLALGIAYKPDVDDVRESPSVFVMEILRDWGAEIAYSDPHVPVFPSMRDHDFDLSSTVLTPDSIAAFDAVVMLTNHSAFDTRMIAEHARMLIDTRGVFAPAPNVVRA
jgi:UDP-N-acetyl-D-glucosamine dehydrogenase